MPQNVVLLLIRFLPFENVEEFLAHRPHRNRQQADLARGPQLASSYFIPLHRFLKIARIFAQRILL